ncbi:hypothetical protein B566_EDAN017927 [Ephemera danica]|nr:hypothetical protein B566_EDAN017927 [Ephemera danica]
MAPYDVSRQIAQQLPFHYPTFLDTCGSTDSFNVVMAPMLFIFSIDHSSSSITLPSQLSAGSAVSTYLYHEVTAVSLLETMLYHSDACKELGDSSVDLVDYCAAAITLLLSNLPLSAVARFYKTHDFPMLLAHLIDIAPWEKQDGNMCKQFTKLYVYTDGHWFDAAENAPITKSEANAWLAFHQLLLFPELGKYYNMTEFAKGQLMKLDGKITNSLLEQLPPLNQLKQGLVKLSTFQLPEQKPPIILEIIPEIRHSLLQEGNKGWGKISKKQTALLINCSTEHAAKIAERMCDSLHYTTKDTHHCSYCHRTAKSRCSRCKKVWYCSRKCQVQHFPSHKNNCTAL